MSDSNFFHIHYNFFRFFAAMYLLKSYDKKYFEEYQNKRLQ